jgi:hypothetical protein
VPLPPSTLFDFLSTAATTIPAVAQEFAQTVPPSVRVQANSSAAIGMAYGDVIALPTSFETIRSRIALGDAAGATAAATTPPPGLGMASVTAHSNLGPHVPIRTLADLCCALLLLVSNCVLFNFPRGFYPAASRSLGRAIVAAWADRCSKLTL